MQLYSHRDVRTLQYTLTLELAIVSSWITVSFLTPRNASPYYLENPRPNITTKLIQILVSQ